MILLYTLISLTKYTSIWTGLSDKSLQEKG